MFFILFLCYVTVGLAALQFNSPSVTLLNIILTYFMFNFYLQNPPHTPSTPSPTDSISWGGGGGGTYLVIPFRTPGKPQRLLGKLLSFFVFVFGFFVFFLFFVFFFTKVRQHSLKSGEVRLGIHQLIEGRLQLTRG